MLKYNPKHCISSALLLKPMLGQILFFQSYGNSYEKEVFEITRMEIVCLYLEKVVKIREGIIWKKSKKILHQNFKHKNPGNL